MTKIIKVRDLTIKELIGMRCPAKDCKSCPFGNYKKDFLSDRLCDLVKTFDKYNVLDKAIEVEYDESK